MVEAANTRARMITGRYRTKQVNAKYSKHAESPICLLCRVEEEDMVHLLVQCPKLSQPRTRKLEVLMSIYREDDVRPPQTPAEVCSAILNGVCYTMENMNGSDCAVIDDCAVNSVYELSPVLHIQASSICNIICHKLHIVRDNMINSHYII